MSQENVDVTLRAFGAWNRGHLDAWLESVHPDIEWISEIASAVEGTEAVFRGHAELRRFWDEFHSVWDLTIEVSEVRDLGGTVVALGRIRTRGRASGIDLERPVAYVGEFDGGLIRRLRAYQDQDQALEAVGLRE
jgi:ketosteroid isomerase-like protein